MDETPQIPDHESAVRRLLAEAHGTPYVPLRRVDEARKYEDGVVILEGDDGGQIYAVSPARLVGCSEATLEQLVGELERIEWGEENNGSSVHYERLPIGAVVGGGMGGGRVTDGIWVHGDLRELGIEDEVRAVIEGRTKHLQTEFEPGWAIVRHDSQVRITHPDQWVWKVRVIKVLADFSEADREVARLNREKSSDSHHYFKISTVVKKP